MPSRDLAAPTAPGGTVRILVTGAGGPAAVAFHKALSGRPVELFAVDVDPFAVGLHLVPPGHAALVPRGDAADFVDELLARCETWGIDLVVPTVDAELLPVARRVADFAAVGAEVAIAPLPALEAALDKLALARRCEGVIKVPRTSTLAEVAGTGPAASGFELPVVIKPRRGSGSRDVHVVASRAAFDRLVERLVPDGDAGGEDWLVQEFLPGEEYSVDVLTRADGTVVAAVPRVRLKVDSGVAVAARTVRDPELEHGAAAVARAIGVTGVANVQLRRDATGVACLLEVNPRLPGTMPLTVAAGVDMPYWLVVGALGGAIPAELDFREVAIVRSLHDHIVPAEAFAAMAGPAPASARGRSAQGNDDTVDARGAA